MPIGYAFGNTLGFLDQEGWYPNFREPTEALLKATHVFRWFPFLKSLDRLAVLMVDYLPTDIALFVRTMQIELPRQINSTREAMEAGLLNSKERHTIFGEILFNEELQSNEKGTKRLAAEGFSIVGAGTETTASAISVITYHLLKQPALLSKLSAELEEHGIGKHLRVLPSLPEL